MDILQPSKAEYGKTSLLPAFITSFCLAVAGCTATPPREPARDVKKTRTNGIITKVYCHNPATGRNETRVYINGKPDHLVTELPRSSGVIGGKFNGAPCPDDGDTWSNKRNQ